MDRRGGLAWKFSLTTLCTTMGLAGMVLLASQAALGFVVLLHLAFGLVAYTLSQALNTRVDSTHRATVLSFKGLAFNLGYGGLGLVYGAVQQARGPEADFLGSLTWLPGAFLAAMAATALWAKCRKL